VPDARNRFGIFLASRASKDLDVLNESVSLRVQSGCGSFQPGLKLAFQAIENGIVTPLFPCVENLRAGRGHRLANANDFSGFCKGHHVRSDRS
jgi:hypothetical protein